MNEQTVKTIDNYALDAATTIMDLRVEGPRMMGKNTQLKALIQIAVRDALVLYAKPLHARILDLQQCVSHHQQSLIDHAKRQDANLVEPLYVYKPEAGLNASDLANKWALDCGKALAEKPNELGYVPSDDILMPFMSLVEDYMAAVDYHGSQKGPRCDAAEAAIRAALIKLSTPAQPAAIRALASTASPAAPNSAGDTKGEGE